MAKYFLGNSCKSFNLEQIAKYLSLDALCISLPLDEISVVYASRYEAVCLHLLPKYSKMSYG